MLTGITVVGALVLVRIGSSMLRPALRGPGETPTPVNEPAPTAGEVPGAGGGHVPERRGRYCDGHRGHRGDRGDRGDRPRATPAPASAPAPGRLGVLLRGAAVSGVNPKGVLLFVALLPQFADPAAARPLWAQLVALEPVFIASVLCAYSLLGFFAREVFSGSDRASRILTGVADAAMLLLTAGMLGGHVLG